MLKILGKYWNLHKISILILLLSVVFYYVFAYQLQRFDFIKLLGLYLALFFFCFKLIQFEKWNFRFLLFAGLAFRLVFLLAEPTLSQDYFRFLWDGHLILLGDNPYLLSPDALMEKGDVQIPNAATLHEGMGALSARHFSNYPPLNQLFFALAALLGGKSIMGTVVAIRIMHIAADLGIFYFGKKLLRYLNKSPYLIFWYFLNPLVIIELTGNLHFEGVMLFFFCAALYFFLINKWVISAILIGASISLKLVPLLFLPLFLKNLGWARSLQFYLLALLVIAGSLVPFYIQEFFSNYSETLKLWFSNFEFNAGIYNLVRQIGIQFEIKPWELIKVYGKITPIIVLALVFWLSFFRRGKSANSLLGSMLIVISAYLFLASTVHPWYIIFALFLCLFTNYRYPLLWSAVIVLSYSAYRENEIKESLFLLGIEYLLVFGFLAYEYFRSKPQNSLIHKN